jgi:hypothetical protein
VVKHGHIKAEVAIFPAHFLYFFFFYVLYPYLVGKGNITAWLLFSKRCTLICTSLKLELDA